jgi:hypothetical protein
LDTLLNICIRMVLEVGLDELMNKLDEKFNFRK